MPHAHIRHRMPGRLRLHIPSKKHDPEYFERVGKKLTELEGVQAVKADSRTGSLLITHEAELEVIGRFAEKHGLFSLVTTTVAAALLADKLTDQVGDLDQGLVQFTRGQMDLKSLMVVFLAGGAAYQVLKKEVLPPAFTLVWAALALIWPGRGGPRVD